MNTEELVVELYDINYIPGYKDAELQRIANEEERKNSETIRIQNETTRETNETTREANEKTRKSNETTRKSNETTRQTNEATREANEKIRQSNELYREEFIGNFESNFDITIPKGTATGSPVEIEDALPYKILELEVEGNSYQEENPTPDNPKEITVIEGDLSIKVVGENLFNKNATPIYSIRATIQDIENGLCITRNGTQSGFVVFEIGDITDYLGQTLTFSYNTPYVNEFRGCALINCDASGLNRTTIKEMGSSNTSLTATIGNNYSQTKLAVRIYLEADTTAGTAYNITNIQLEKGSIATEYKAYQETITEIDLQDNFIAKLPNGTKDRLYLKNGRLHLEQNVGKVVLNGSENWKTEQTTNNLYIYRVENLFNVGSKENSGISDYFIYDIKYGGTEPHFYLNVNGIHYFFSYITTLSEFKTWLSENNVTVYYELSTPVIHDLGNCAIETFEGINNIFLNANLNTNMSVKYALDIKKYTDKKISDITNALISLGANI